MAGTWSNRDWLRGAGDVNGDKREDVITRVGSRLYVHLGTKSGGFAAPKIIASGLSGISAITALGDVDGDKRSDLVARLSSGRLKLTAAPQLAGRLDHVRRQLPRHPLRPVMIIGPTSQMR